MADLVEVVERSIVVDVTEPRMSTVIEVVQQGPQGPPGPATGIDEIEAMVGVAIGDYFVLHPQSYTWPVGDPVYHVEVAHPLDHWPAVSAVDSAGDLWRGAVSYPAANRVAVDFNVPFAGKITLT